MYWTAKKVDKNTTFTTGFPTKTIFDGIVWLNRAMIILCQGFCYIKDIRIYIVIWIIYNNVFTEITCLQKNMVALQNLDLSKNLAPLAPLRIQPLLIVRSHFSFWNLAPQALFFQPPSLLPGMKGAGRGSVCYAMHMMTSQILKSVDFTKTKEPWYLENKALFFLQIKKLH